LQELIAKKKEEKRKREEEEAKRREEEEKQAERTNKRAPGPYGAWVPVEKSEMYLPPTVH